jgi:hypothetical protein
MGIVKFLRGDADLVCPLCVVCRCVSFRKDVHTAIFFSLSVIAWPYLGHEF